MKYPTKKEIISRARGYISRIEDEKIPREKLDTAFILKNIFRDYLPSPSTKSIKQNN